MILPTKHISERQALLGVGGVLLQYLENPQTVTSLWNKVRNHRSVGTFERFVLALDFLYISGIIIINRGFICRGCYDS